MQKSIAAAASNRKYNIIDDDFEEEKLAPMAR
jgi:hypothetical protein